MSAHSFTIKLYSIYNLTVRSVYVRLHPPPIDATCVFCLRISLHSNKPKNTQLFGSFINGSFIVNNMPVVGSSLVWTVRSVARTDYPAAWYLSSLEGPIRAGMTNYTYAIFLPFVGHESHLHSKACNAYQYDKLLSTIFAFPAAFTLRNVLRVSSIDCGCDMYLMLLV